MVAIATWVEASLNGRMIFANISKIKNLSRGSRCYFPVFVEGANLSVGDLHFSQGDVRDPRVCVLLDWTDVPQGEMTFCGAIEMVSPL